MKHSVLVALVAATTLHSGCLAAECATPDYTRAECRVLAEHEFARLSTREGIEVRFQERSAADTSGWAALGLVKQRDDGTVVARVAHPGDFALSLENPGEAEVTLALRLANVHPDATIRVGATGVEQEIGTQATISVGAGEAVWVRGSLDCQAKDYRLAVLADVQTNPTQFARILERIEQERDDAAAAGELLAGVIMPGDLTESSEYGEFLAFAELLDRTTLPVALTPGNHDVYEANQPFYNQAFGPGNYAFNVCSARVAMLDSGSGAIAESVVGRLPQMFDAEGAEYLIAAVHHPPIPRVTGAGWSREDLAMITLGEFAYQGGDLVLAGHAHLLSYFDDGSAGGSTVGQIIAGTAGADQGVGSPLYGYVRLTFRGGTHRIEQCFVEVPPPGAPAAGKPGLSVPLCED